MHFCTLPPAGFYHDILVISTEMQSAVHSMQCAKVVSIFILYFKHFKHMAQQFYS